MARQSKGLQREAERRQWLDERAVPASVSGRRTRYFHGARYRLGAQEEQYAHLLVSQLQSAVGAASAALRAMETPPGRKAMILLSGGWAWDPAQWVARDYRRMISDPRIPRGAELYGPLSDTANLLGYTIYAFDMPSLQAGGRVDASLRAPRPGASASEFFLEQEIHDSLRFLADETGGRALINGSRIQAVTEVSSDVRSYYWLGFSPDWTRDNERHEIRVEVDYEDLQVRARQGFPDLSPQSQTALAVQSSLLFGKAGGSDALQVELGQPEEGKKRKLNVPVTISISASELATVERDGKWVSEVDLFIAAMDEGGGRAEVPPIPLVFSSSRRPKAGDKLVYTTTLTVRKKTTELAIAVYDRNGGKRFTRVLVKGSQ